MFVQTSAYPPYDVIVFASKTYQRQREIISNYSLSKGMSDGKGYVGYST